MERLELLAYRLQDQLVDNTLTTSPEQPKATSTQTEAAEAEARDELPLWGDLPPASIWRSS